MPCARSIFAVAALAISSACVPNEPPPISCSPSFACAIEMARAAGRQNYRQSKNNFEYVMALLQIADLQRAAGDMPQFAATANEIRLAIDGFEGGKVPVGLRANIARVQAQAGFVEDALSTARSIPDPTTRSKGYGYVGQSLVASGRWRDALAVANATRAVALQPDGSRAYTFDAPNGSDAGVLLAFDLTTTLNGDSQYSPIDAGIPMNPGNGTGAIAMTITPEGGTVFVAGVSGIYVQPVP